MTLSLWVATASTVVAVLVGVPLAFGLERWRSRAKVFVEALVLWPLVMPTSVLGYFALVVLARGSAVGRAFESITGAPLLFSTRAAVIAACVTAVPLVVRATQSALASVDPALLFAARSLGASEWFIARNLTAPLSSRRIIAAATVAFARSLGEFGVTLVVLARSEGASRTASLAVFDSLRAGPSAQGQSLAVVLAALTLGAALFVQWLLAPRTGRD